MGEKVSITTKTSETKRENPVSQKQKSDFSQPTGSPYDHIMFLQRTIGNQAVMRMLKKSAESKAHGAQSNRPLCAKRPSPCTVQAKLKIGQPNDIYEQEADRVAKQVMRMPDEQHVADSSLRSIAYGHSPSAIGNKPYAISHTLSEDESIQRKPT